MQLDGKAALVTGAGGGLGGATARRFAAEGASVLCTDRDLARAERTVADIELAGGTAMAFEADIADPAQCEAQVAETVVRFGKIDILVNNAGVHEGKQVTECTEAEWDRCLDTHVKAAFLTSKHAIPLMRPEGGSIINMSSNAGPMAPLPPQRKLCVTLVLLQHI